MPPPLTQLPFTTASAAHQMATDSALRVLAKETDRALIRFYGWSEAAATFGYSQRWADLRPLLPPSVALLRRESGGGLVDHRNDLTYALVLPPTHPAFRLPSTTFYAAVHRHLAAALVDAGVPADLAPCACSESDPTPLAAMCFQRAEPADVIFPATGQKMAGAALRRHASALLLQGSLERRALPPDFAEQRFRAAFVHRLAKWLEASVSTAPLSLPHPWPPSALREKFASEGWNRRR